MSTGSSIEWTDATWNPVVGCTPVSAGCLNCYAAAEAHRWAHPHKKGPKAGRPVRPEFVGLTVMRGGIDVADCPGCGNNEDGCCVCDHTGKVRASALGMPASPRRVVFNGTVRCLEDRLAEPLSWRKPRRVFVNSMSDLFHEDVPFEFIDQVFAVMALCPRHTFQVLTKRPERMAEYLTGRRPLVLKDYCATALTPWHIWSVIGSFPGAVSVAAPWCWGPGGTLVGPWPLPNIWLGTSVENQAAADARIPHLLRCPAAARIVSQEPQLSRVVYRDEWAGGLHQVMVGGESGPNARHFDMAWAKETLAWCRANGLAFFLKQIGTRPCNDDEYEECVRCKHCGATGSEQVFDVLGADPGNLFCNTCGREIPHGYGIKSRKGGDPAEWPPELNVREFPVCGRG